MTLIAFLLNLPISLIALLFLTLVSFTEGIPPTSEKFGLSILALYSVIPAINMFLLVRKPATKTIPIYGLIFSVNIMIGFLSLIFIAAPIIPIWIACTVIVTNFQLIETNENNKNNKKKTVHLGTKNETADTIFSIEKLKRILLEDYNFTPGFIEALNLDDEENYKKIIKEKYDEDRVAHIYYTAVVYSGYKNHPDYFNTDISTDDGKNILPRSINKIFFGAYYPDRNDYIRLGITYIIIALFGYQCSEIFMTPPIDSFLPSSTWIKASIWMNLTFSIFIFISFLKRIKEKTYPLRYKKNQKWTVPFMPIMIFFFLHIAITYSAAEILSETYGADSQKTIIVEKHKNRQCVQLNEFQNTLLLKPVVCVLSKKDYKNMGTDPIEMTFTGKESILGFVVKDYEWPDKDK